jgi:predicted metal-dependent hydrolase
MGLTLPKVPTLSWSKTVSRHRFGHWDPDHNAVVISQVLDDPDVPEFVLDYVLYHELLHILHPVKMGSATKRIVHSAAFRRDERRFPRWKEGEEWIRRLARRRGR